METEAQVALALVEPDELRDVGRRDADASMLISFHREFVCDDRSHGNRRLRHLTVLRDGSDWLTTGYVTLAHCRRLSSRCCVSDSAYGLTMRIAKSGGNHVGSGRSVPSAVSCWAAITMRRREPDYIGRFATFDRFRRHCSMVADDHHTTRLPRMKLARAAYRRSRGWTTSGSPVSAVPPPAIRISFA